MSLSKVDWKNNQHRNDALNKYSQSFIDWNKSKWCTPCCGLIVLVVFGVKAKDFFAVDLNMCQDIPNIIINSNQPYDLTLEMDSIKFEGNSTAKKICVTPNHSDPIIRGLIVEVKDKKDWKYIKKAFMNNPKLPLGRKELMFSANNTNDIGAFTNYTNTILTTLGRDRFLTWSIQSLPSHTILWSTKITQLPNSEVHRPSLSVPTKSPRILLPYSCE